MNINELTAMISGYKIGGTNQHWRRDPDMRYENEYIRLLRIDSSNESGGERVHRGKQWSIIIDIKKDFTHLPNWKNLENYYKKELAITPVDRGVLKGYDGIRFYHMSQNPTDKTVKEILDYIFE